MFERKIEPFLKKALQRSPVVLLNGARQVGKTTLALEVASVDGYQYVTFDDEITYLAAKANPSGFLQDIKKPVIIDEVQRVPEIFLAIKRDVDKHRFAGRYLLTGSANPLLIPTLGDSLAGRMEIIDLMTLSQAEIYNSKGEFIDWVFSSQSLAQPVLSLTKEELYQRVIIGGYPSLHTYPPKIINEEIQEAWVRNYINILLSRDVKDLASIEKITEMPKLLHLLAARAASLLNVAEVARDSKLVAKTVHRYISLLETIFIMYIQPAWSSNRAMRFIKSPKVYINDTGILFYLLGLTLQRALDDSLVMGKVLENFVVEELRKQASWSKTRISLHHFRTSEGREVDLVLEDRLGTIVGIEVKGSSHVGLEDFKGLRYLQEKLKNKFLKGFVIYSGNQLIPFGDDLYALPYNVLWD